MAKRTTKRRRKPVTRSRRRRAGRRSSSGGFSLRGGFINKELLIAAGGVVAGSLGTSLALAKLRGTNAGAKFLPQPKAGEVDYKGAAVAAGVGILGGVLLRKANPKMATSFAIGGVAAAALTIIAGIRLRSQIAAAAATPQGPPISGMGQYLLPDGSVVEGYEVDGYEPAAVNGYEPMNAYEYDPTAQ